MFGHKAVCADYEAVCKDTGTVSADSEAECVDSEAVCEDTGTVCADIFMVLRESVCVDILGRVRVCRPKTLCADSSHCVWTLVGHPSRGASV